MERHFMTNEERINNSKNRIFEAALAEFSEKGYAGASVNNITKAGIPKGLLYHIYKNKDEIYLACVDRCFRELMECLDSGSTGTNAAGTAAEMAGTNAAGTAAEMAGTDAAEAPAVETVSLEAYMSARRRFLLENPEKGKIIFEAMNPVAPAVDPQIAEIRKPFDDFNRRYFGNMLAGLPMRKGISEEIALKYFTLVQSALNSYYIQRTDDAWMEHEEVLPAVLDLILYGVAEKKGEK